MQPTHCLDVPESLAKLGHLARILAPYPEWPVGLRVKPVYATHREEDVYEVLGYTPRGRLILGRTDNDHEWCTTVQEAQENYTKL